MNNLGTGVANRRGEIRKGDKAARVLPQRVLLLLRPALGWLSGLFFSIRYEGLENIPRSGGFIIVANHQTYFDPFWVGIPVKSPLRFLAWSETLRWPVVGKLIQILGAWPLHVEGSDPTAIRRSLRWLRDGGAIVIFPEGGRGLPDGSMLRFKPGAARIALVAAVPILPVTICGAHRIWPGTQRFPRPGKVSVRFHPAHKIEQRCGENTRQCARREMDLLAEIISPLRAAVDTPSISEVQV